MAGTGDLEQWANGQFGSVLTAKSDTWQNGNLNPNNSSYQEGQVVDYRLEFSSLKAGHTYDVMVRYASFFDGNYDAKAFDGLVSYTQYNTSPNDPMPDYLTGTAVTNASPQADNGAFHIWNAVDGSIVVGAPVVETDNKGNQDTLVKVTFTAAQDGEVVIGFGAHIAQTDIVGGAGVINGSPYHVQLDKVQGDSNNLWVGGQEDLQLGTHTAGTASLTIDKVVDLTEVNGPATLTYTITVVNNGSVDLTGVDLSDPGQSLTLSGDANNNGTLDTGETWIYTGSHQVTQDDIDQGGNIINTAHVTTTQTSDQSSTAETTVTQNAHMTVAKAGPASVSAPGTISYTIDVTNDGNVTLDAPVVADANATVSTTYTGDTGAHAGQLDVGETWEFTATRTVTQDQIDHGTTLTNTAVASSDSTITHKQTGDDQSNEVNTTIHQNAAMTVTKTATEQSVGTLGQTVHYTIDVANTGNMTLTTPALTDPNATVSPTYTGDTDGNSKLSVGETWEYTATHVVTQDDLDNGHIDNTADAAASTLYTGQTLDESGFATTSVDQHAHMTVAKAGPASVSAPGTISYTIDVTNDGNVTLDAPVVTDANATVSTTYTGDTGAHAGQLDVGETWELTATRTVTQDQIDHGTTLTNTAVASSESTITHLGTGDDTSNTVPTTIIQTPSIDVTKTLNPNATGGTYAHTDTSNAPKVLVGDKSGHDAGTSLSWQYTVQNTGNVTLKDVFVSDNVLGSITLGTTDLAPVASTTGTASQALHDTANFIGLHTNTATAGADTLYDTTPGVTPDTDTGAYVGVQGGISIDKVISTDGGLSWSDGPVKAFANLQLSYKVTVTDTSDSGLHVAGIGVSDTQATVTGVDTSLAHGGSDVSDIYHTLSGPSGGTNTATVNATVSDDYGHSMGVSATDSVSYTTVAALAGLSKGYWANHSWTGYTGSTLVLGDSDLSHSTAGDKYDISFDTAGAQLMDNSSTTGDARIILGGQLVAAQLDSYMNHATATGLLDAGAKWFWKFGLQDDNTTFDSFHTGGSQGSALGGTVGSSEWTNDKKNGFTFKEGAAVSTNDAGAWKGDLFSFNYISQLDGQNHKVGVTGEGLKNALAAFDHGLSGTDGLVVSPNGDLIAWQGGSNTSFQYDNTATTFQGDHSFWGDLKGGAFIAVLNDAELANKVSIVGIHDDSGHNNT